MLLVRKTLTEILLEVTDEKIQEISSETLSKYRRKGICAIENILFVSILPLQLAIKKKMKIVQARDKSLMIVD